MIEDYTPDEELKKMKQQLGVTNREIARHIGKSPSMVNLMLNGFIRFRQEDRRKILEFMKHLMAEKVQRESA